LEFFPKILIQTAQVPELLGDAKILPKSQPAECRATDDRQADRQTDAFAITQAEHNV